MNNSHPIAIELCSIVNIHSGNCSENCLFCAQSRHNSCDIEKFDSIDQNNLIYHAEMLQSHGVKYISLVASGRGPSKELLATVTALTEKILSNTTLQVCCSLGLLTKSDANFLKKSGISRYHHNLETAESFFTQVCSTHSFDDRIRTIENAREAGLEVCSGGMINIGENMEDRISMVETAIKKGATSVPLNVLLPVEGTPLYGKILMDPDELIYTITSLCSMFPDTIFRFAGGRSQYSEEVTIKSLKAGIRGIMTGNYLTEAGIPVDKDIKLIGQNGYSVAS
ncbi:MAG: biotin synthase BioB [Spirochaetes bacterium]|nr:biotin synthase BioB [Spirochaetota bacterium]MBN2772216.1 biotin synthase BioB [Spirochaetota bacterium]